MNAIKSIGLLFLLAFAVNASANCLKFSQIPTTFIRDLALDVKSAKLRFRPLKFGENFSGFLVQDDASCSVHGSCDSVFYLSKGAACYRQVVSFRGRWQDLTDHYHFDAAEMEK